MILSLHYVFKDMEYIFLFNNEIYSYSSGIFKIFQLPQQSNPKLKSDVLSDNGFICIHYIDFYVCLDPSHWWKTFGYASFM